MQPPRLTPPMVNFANLQRQQGVEEEEEEEEEEEKLVEMMPCHAMPCHARRAAHALLEM
jgi:hypothetical protein